MIITIDGPAASGKSTISRTLAHELNYFYLCSGLLYRALAYLLVNHRNYSLESLENPSSSDIDDCLNPEKFIYCYDRNNNEHIFFAHEDITPYLKEKIIDQLTSIISGNTYARMAITKMQKHIAFENDTIVIEGRDVGSHVFPDADIKFFITASIDVRAQRWKKDQEKYGNNFTIEQAITTITDRDERDKNRVVGPLIVPENAIIIDTSDLTIVESVNKMLEYLKNINWHKFGKK
jgi:CMP/dCMP kinase